ncbi:MAG TPA: hypothetical protein DDY20_11970 [Desulfobulbaceae bacterium]|nr:hypothetical protein [Desulfobulbaceae bacterium]
MTGFFDIHSHFLPGLDDGPEDYGQCLEAAKRYVAIGVDRVIATPHWIQGSRWTPTPEEVRRRTAEAEQWLHEAGMGLILLPGMEIALSDSLCRHFIASDFISLAEQGYFLIEFPLISHLKATAADVVGTMLKRQQENHFIIAHPERCIMFQENLDSIRKMVAGGMLTQVNISSILGYSGKTAQMAALKLCNENLVHFLGSDSHARAGRMPPDPKEMSELAGLIGADAVAAGFRDNPNRLLLGEQVFPLQMKATEPGSTLFPSLPKKVVQGLLKLFRKQ